MQKIKDKGFGVAGSKRRFSPKLPPMPKPGTAKKGADSRKNCLRSSVAQTPEERKADLARRRALSRTGDTSFIVLVAVPNQAPRFESNYGPRRPFARPSRSDDPSYRNGGSITGDGSRAAARAKPRRTRAKKAAA